MHRVLTRRQIVASIAGGFLATGAITACDDSDEGARAVDDEEASRLAVARFNNYDRHTVEIDVQLENNGIMLFLQGMVDFREHVGYTTVVTGERPPGRSLLQWTLTMKAVTGAASDELPLPPPVSGWQTAGVDGSLSVLDTALLVVLHLGSDRPENPLLLRQNGAQWLGTEVIDGVEVDLFHGPGADNETDEQITYGVDDAGVMRRVTVDLASSSIPLVINLHDASGEPVPRISALA